MLQTLLVKLSDGEFHSGAELGRHLGVSRAAVWKQLKKLKEYDVDVFSVPGKGYQLIGGLELFNEKNLRSYLSKESNNKVSQLDIYLSVESTNDHVLRFAQQSIGKDNYVCLAEQQTQGRGRRGRYWVSPFGRNICCSMLWHFSKGMHATEGLSLVVGVAIVNALESIGITGIKLKWPNDVIWNDKKLAGILIEVTGDLTDECQAVIGFGLNIALSDKVKSAIGQPFVDIKTILEMQGRNIVVSRNQIAGLMLEELMNTLGKFNDHGFELFKSTWQKLDGYKDRQVNIISANKVITGFVQGIDERGALLLKTNDGIQHIHSGEVSMRESS